MSTTQPLGFIIMHEAWYWRSGDKYDAEIMIGDYVHADGDGWVADLGEFGIRWYMLGGQSTPRLEMYQGSWLCLHHPQCRRLLDWLAGQHKQYPTPRNVSAFLASIEMVDKTERINPHAVARRSREDAAFRAGALWSAEFWNARDRDPTDEEIATEIAERGL